MLPSPSALPDVTETLSPAERRTRTLRSLEGLAIGDAFGEQFYDRPYDESVGRHELLPAPWPWTADTQMALSIVETLFDRQGIDQALLVQRLQQRFEEDAERGYDANTMQILRGVAKGGTWRDEAKGLANGGSFSNSAAARAAPIGAYFSNHPARAADEARLAASVTHAHTDGQAGAIAVTVTAALLGQAHAPRSEELLLHVMRVVPRGRVRTALEQASQIAAHEHATARAMLGTGEDRTAFDTVPFCVWVVAHHGSDFEDALWMCASAGGDVSTTCALVGGILGAAGHRAPADWRRCCEPLPLALQLDSEPS